MGSFNQACSLSGTPIRGNDECYLVMLKGNFGFRQTLQIEPRNFSYVIHGIYDEYGNFKKIIQGDEKDLAVFDEVYQERNEDLQPHFWVSAEAWQWAQKLMENSTSGYLTGEWDEEILSGVSATKPWWYKEAYRVILAHEQIWRNPLSGYNVARNIDDIDENFAAMKSLHQITIERMEKILAWYEEY